MHIWHKDIITGLVSPSWPSWKCVCSTIHPALSQNTVRHFCLRAVTQAPPDGAGDQSTASQLRPFGRTGPPCPAGQQGDTLNLDVGASRQSLDANTAPRGRRVRHPSSIDPVQLVKVFVVCYLCRSVSPSSWSTDVRGWSTAGRRVPSGLTKTLNLTVCCRPLPWARSTDSRLSIICSWLAVSLKDSPVQPRRTVLGLTTRPPIEPSTMEPSARAPIWPEQKTNPFDTIAAAVLAGQLDLLRVFMACRRTEVWHLFRWLSLEWNASRGPVRHARVSTRRIENENQRTDAEVGEVR